MSTYFLKLTNLILHKKVIHFFLCDVLLVTVTWRGQSLLGQGQLGVDITRINHDNPSNSSFQKSKIFTHELLTVIL